MRTRRVPVHREGDEQAQGDTEKGGRPRRVPTHNLRVGVSFPLLHTHILPTPSPPKRGGITWDEANLQMNEEEKVPRCVAGQRARPHHTHGARLIRMARCASGRMKIDEPDTPYHYYNEEDEEELGARLSPTLFRRQTPSAPVCTGFVGAWRTLVQVCARFVYLTSAKFLPRFGI